MFGFVWAAVRFVFSVCFIFVEIDSCALVEYVRACRLKRKIYSCFKVVDFGLAAHLGGVLV